jgi:hypothetical protein
MVGEIGSRADVEVGLPRNRAVHCSGGARATSSARIRPI